jgi:hypothetical protein
MKLCKTPLFSDLLNEGGHRIFVLLINPLQVRKREEISGE